MLNLTNENFYNINPSEGAPMRNILSTNNISHHFHYIIECDGSFHPSSSFAGSGYIIKGATGAIFAAGLLHGLQRAKRGLSTISELDQMLRRSDVPSFLFDELIDRFVSFNKNRVC